MAETTSPPPSPAPNDPPKHTRSPLNQALVDELSLAEQLIATAAKPAYAAKLADEEIDADFLTDLSAKIAEADALAGSTTGKKADKKGITQQEKTLKDALLEELASIQKRVKRKYKSTDDPQREKYFIGERIDSNRGLLERATRAVLKALETDTLPGLKPAHINSLSDALAAYIAIQGGQTGGQSDASSDRTTLEARVKVIAELRREIQYAADILWPASKKAHAAIRTEFQIPPDRGIEISARGAARPGLLRGPGRDAAKTPAGTRLAWFRPFVWLPVRQWGMLGPVSPQTKARIRPPTSRAG